jgi:hypothetical protein
MTRLSHEPKAYQWALPEGLEVPPDEIQVRLDFHQDTILMYVLDKGVITTRMVSASEIALALLREVPLSSGLLPQGALWWSQGRDGPEIALWRHPRVWAAALQEEAFKPPRRFRLPMPGLIFICQVGRPPRIYAARGRPRSPEDIIYHAPLFNIFWDGRTCPGTHRFPPNIEEIPESFFASFFTATADHNGRSKRYPNDLRGLWEELDGKKRYPLRDLVPLGKVEDIMK